MNKIRLSMFLFVLFILFFLSVRFGFAQDSNSAVSAALCEYGIELYEKGDTTDAVHELKKALIVDPGNVTARNYLSKIYSEMNFVTNQALGSPRAAGSDGYQSQINKLQQESHNYQKQLESLNDKYAAKTSELDRLNRELNAQKDILYRKEQELQAAHKVKAEGKCDSLKNQINKLQEGAVSYQKQIKSLNDKYTVKESELDRLSRELKAQKDLIAKRGDELAISTKGKGGGGEGKTKILESQINKLKQEARNYQKELEVLNGKYTVKESELKKLARGLETERAFFTKREQELIAANKIKRIDKGEGLKNQTSKLQQEVNSCQKQVMSLNDKYAIKVKEVDRLTDELKNQKDVLAKKERDLLAARKTKKEDDCEDLKGKISKVKKESNDCQGQLKSLNDKYAAKTKELNKLILELRVQKGLLDKRERELAAARQTGRGSPKAARRESECEDLKNQVGQLKKENFSYENRLQALENNYLANLKKKDDEIKKIRSQVQHKQASPKPLNKKTESACLDSECQFTGADSIFSK